MKRFEGKPTICIVDDEEMMLDLLVRMLKNKYKIITYTNSKELLKKDINFFNNLSLLILDINLRNRKENGIQLSEKLYNLGYNQPRLFMSGRYSSDDFLLLSKNINDKYTFDFIKKPFDINNVVNRIKILIDIFKYQLLLKYEQDKSIEMVWDMLNHSLLFIVMIDKNFKIQLANYAISKELGYENEKELIGKDWSEFVDPSLTTTIQNIHKEISKGKERFKEFSYQIYSKNHEPTRVKWFTSYANGNLNLCVGIGAPYRDTKSHETIESVRSYFKDIVEQDSNMIQALKKSMIKNQGLIVTPKIL